MRLVLAIASPLGAVNLRSIVVYDINVSLVIPTYLSHVDNLLRIVLRVKIQVEHLHFPTQQLLV